MRLGTRSQNKPHEHPVVTRLAVRGNTHISCASCKRAQIDLDTDLADNPDAFNPAGLLLAALLAYMTLRTPEKKPTP